MLDISLRFPIIMDKDPKEESTSGGWLMTSIAPWGVSHEDAFDQALVELGLGDARLIEAKGAMLPMGFEPEQPRPLPMGSLVECHIAVGNVYDEGIASAGAAWAIAETPEGDECAIVATISTDEDADETTMLLKNTLRNRLASRDLEVIEHDIAVDEVTPAQNHHGVVIASLILPKTLNFQPKGAIGRVREIVRENTSETSSTSEPTRKSDGTRQAEGGMSFDL